MTPAAALPSPAPTPKTRMSVEAKSMENLCSTVRMLWR